MPTGRPFTDFPVKHTRCRPQKKRSMALDDSLRTTRHRSFFREATSDNTLLRLQFDRRICQPDDVKQPAAGGLCVAARGLISEFDRREFVAAGTASGRLLSSRTTTSSSASLPAHGGHTGRGLKAGINLMRWFRLRLGRRCGTGG